MNANDDVWYFQCFLYSDYHSFRVEYFLRVNDAITKLTYALNIAGKHVFRDMNVQRSVENSNDTHGWGGSCSATIAHASLATPNIFNLALLRDCFLFTIPSYLIDAFRVFVDDSSNPVFSKNISSTQSQPYFED
uniref:AlNc14C481G11892 protein n=1 Tax=Albugo laibachii Nc14 TaxID=890382 RepID=F0X0F1_9STRA|nr:AlNc14C481G11892 [Albugo laibachii Nc14]|eukprot:CCA27238.1 AlNc14C481G11892 [Albugo laibachii Nc14]